MGPRLGARGLHDVLLYHMVVSDLYAAGCPTGARLTEFPGWPTRDEAHRRIVEAVPFVPHIQNTSCFWGVRIILKDLYGWDEPITTDNWEKLDALIRERADDGNWHRQIMQRSGVQRCSAELRRRGNGEGDDVLQYSLEWGFFTATQPGVYDTALRELERCWGQDPNAPDPPADANKPGSERAARTLADVHDALDSYVQAIPFDRVISMATHISTDIDLRPVDDAEMATALQRRDQAGPVTRDIYASYVHEAFLTALTPYAERFVFQFSLGAEPLPYETGSRLAQRTIAQLAEMIARHPHIRFQCLLGSRHGNQSLCTLCRELPNLSLAGYWWHNFFPGAVLQVMEERLDMLPCNKQIGFFSDAYCIEWTYAKAAMVRALLAQVLARKIALGQYTRRTALDVARAILYDAPQHLLSMEPTETA